MDHVRAAKQRKRLSEQTVYAAVPGALLSSQEETPDGSSGSNGAECSQSSSLDQSFSVRLNINEDSDPDSDPNGDKGTVDFTSTDAQHVYHDWVKQQPKDTVKMVAVMAMDTFMLIAITLFLD